MNMPWREGNQIRLLENGEQFFPRVYGALQRARERVLLETFILFNDKVGKALQRELLAAAKRGVRITLMVDGYGSAGLPKEFVSSLTSAGVRFLYYDPRPLFLGVRTNVFRRLHRKVVVCDGDIAFVGGINFSHEHLSDYGPQAKQDYAVELKGPIVDDIARYTEAAMSDQPPPRRRWGRRRRESAQVQPGDAQARFVWRDNHQHRDDIEHGYMEMLRSARRDVIIANAYFFPGYHLLREMRNAAQRGVRVQLIVQGKPDMAIVKVGAELLYNYLISAGVEIYEYRRRPLHAKIAVQDEYWSTVGSSNLDPLSLSLNLEANLFIHDRAFNHLMRENLNQLLNEDCLRIEESHLPARSWWQLSKSVVAFHFLRHFPAIAGWLPAHTPRLAEVEPPEQPQMETQDRVDSDNPGGKP
ncbi:cardiolipin synthase B [Izhakiella australiensis]|uniref:Cardiolipin synthase B n=1 Tax=Izhakiella australiensis TaxID=1926881 RepID=A0A1S8YIZ7_9GAMM|nr:cardiolipin synthase ClsB [Izhakiella australiensis]OON38858.1 cardiolipin synthase B [Izhakiella australiensis]